VSESHDVFSEWFMLLILLVKIVFFGFDEELFKNNGYRLAR